MCRLDQRLAYGTEILLAAAVPIMIRARIKCDETKKKMETPGTEPLPNPHDTSIQRKQYVNHYAMSTSPLQREIVLYI